MLETYIDGFIEMLKFIIHIGWGDVDPANLMKIIYLTCLIAIITIIIHIEGIEMFDINEPIWMMINFVSITLIPPMLTIVITFYIVIIPMMFVDALLKEMSKPKYLISDKYKEKGNE